jgi:hypothetical protein
MQTYLPCLRSSPPPEIVSCCVGWWTNKTYQWPLKRIAIRLEPPHRICHIGSSWNNLVWGSAQVLQDVLELVAGRRRLSHVELELGPLCFVLRLMRAGLVLSGMSYRLRVGLLEESEHTHRRLVVGLVK